MSTAQAPAATAATMAPATTGVQEALQSQQLHQAAGPIGLAEEDAFPVTNSTLAAECAVQHQAPEQQQGQRKAGYAALGCPTVLHQVS